MSKAGTDIWSEVTTSGDAPDARQLHTAVTWVDPSNDEPKMTVFGGNDGTYKNDVHILNLVTGAWSEVTTSGDAPTARYGYTAVSWIDPNTYSINMTVFGGYDGAMKNDVYTLLLMTMPSIRRPKGVVLCGKC